MVYSPRGRTARATLSEADARQIRFRAKMKGATSRELAADYKVGMETIRRVLRWETFAWVGEEGPGATAEEWEKAMPPLIIPSPEDFFARHGLAAHNAGPTRGGQASVPTLTDNALPSRETGSSGPAPDMMENLRREAARGDGAAAAAAVERKLAEDAAAEDKLLDGLTGGAK